MRHIRLLATLATLTLLVTSCSAATSTLKVGDCFNASDAVLTGEEHLANVDTISCDRPHNSEVVGIQLLEDGAYPGEQHLAKLTHTFCTDSFKDYVGIPYEDSRYDLYPLNPSQESWDRNDDRIVACIALSLPKRSDSAANTNK